MSGYGIYGRPIEVFEKWKAWAKDPAVLEGLAEAEGTGAPEGRADFPIYLQSVIRRKVRERFATVASKWQSYMGTENARDLRKHEVVQLNGLSGVGPINEDGTYPAMRSDEEEGPSFSVGKHGGWYSVTEELILDDDADLLLNRIPAEMGKAFAQYQSRVFTAFVESNPTYGPDGQPFFSSARGNQVTGAAAQPNESNLMAMLDLMALRTDKHGDPFTVSARRILVRTPSQKARFDAIIRSQQTGMRDTAAANTSRGFGSFGSGTDNPAYNVLPADAVIDEPWLKAPSQYLILGDADDRPAFIAAFLRGQQQPFIGLRNPEVRSAYGAGQDPYRFSIDTIDYKGKHFFGVAPGEPLAALRATPS